MQHYHPEWMPLFEQEFKKDYFQKIKTELLKIPPSDVAPQRYNLFHAFRRCSLSQLKVVILGQDPYHGVGQAHGLSFSVPHNMPLPPSLKNIFNEIETDLKTPMKERHGDLSSWADQGVLLLNAVLTVTLNQPASHARFGWQLFTDTIIKHISDHKNNVVFLLWGSYAQQKKQLIDSNKHLILMSVHPSPLSAHRGFLGCRHFSQTNHYLVAHQQTPILWHQ